MRWLFPILGVAVATTTTAAPTEPEMERAAKVTCAIIAETRYMDAALRVERVNDAREKLGLEPYLEGDDQIVQAIRYDVCELLVLDRNWQNELSNRRIAELRLQAEQDAEQKKREAEQLAAIRQRVAEQGYAKNDQDASVQNGVAYLKGDNSPFTGVVETYYDNGRLSIRQNYEEGKPHGLKEAFFEDGTLRWRETFEHGKTVWQEIYNENGKLVYSARN